MSRKDAEETRLFQWVIRCLQEKLNEGVNLESQTTQTHRADSSRHEGSGPTDNNGSETDPTVTPTASLGGRRQREPREEAPDTQAEPDEEGEEDNEAGSDSEGPQQSEDEREGDQEPPGKRR